MLGVWRKVPETDARSVGCGVYILLLSQWKKNCLRAPVADKQREKL